MKRLTELLVRFKHILVVFGFTIVSHLLGFGREVAIAHYYGASSISDGLLVGLAPITFFLGVFGISYANASMTRIKTTENKALIAKSLSPMMVITIAALLLFYFGNELMISITAPGLSGQGLVLAREIVLLSALGAGIGSVYYYFRGLSFLDKRFTRVSIADLMPNIAILLGIFVLYRIYGVTGIAIGITLGYLLQLLIVFEHRHIKLSDFHFSNLYDSDTKIIYRNTLFSALGTSGVIVDLFIDRYFASQLHEGAIASLSFAYKVMNLPLYTAVLAVVTVMFPKMIALRDESDAFNRSKQKTNLLLMSLCIASALFLVVFSGPVVSLLFEHGAFDGSDAANTAPLLSVYAIGIPAMAYIMFNAKVFFALEDFKTPLYAGLCAALTNGFLDFLLVDQYGSTGLAAATVVAAYINATILMLAARKLQRK